MIIFKLLESFSTIACEKGQVYDIKKLFKDGNVYEDEKTWKSQLALNN